MKLAAGYRPCLGACIFDHSGRILVGKRSINKKQAVGTVIPPSKEAHVSVCFAHVLCHISSGNVHREGMMSMPTRAPR